MRLVPSFRPILGWAAIGLAAISPPLRAEPPPNIIVIVSDDAGYADFGFMDREGVSGSLSGTTSEVPTPHLDALADRGVRFARAYVAANCQPTRAAIVTGGYQQRIGNESVGNDHFNADQVFEGIPVDTLTIWDRMKALGYTTGAIGKWHLGQYPDVGDERGNRPQNQGIDEFYGMWHGSRNYLAGAYSDRSDNPDHVLQPRYIREAFSHPDGSTSETVVEFTKHANAAFPDNYITTIFGNYAEQFVANHYDDDAPFFLYVAHPAPHKPWTNESPDYDDPRITHLTPNNRRQVASMMITMDREIGELMAKLEDPNGDGDDADSIAENTMVIFINDNGGVAGKTDGVNGTNNGKLSQFKGSPQEGGIRVPMILAGAGLDPTKRNTIYYNPVHSTDILATAVTLGGGTIGPDEDKVDGVNLLPFLNGENEGSPHDVVVHRWRGSFSVIKGDWKLVNKRNIGSAPNFYELYKIAHGDADDDIGENNNLAKDSAHAERIAQMMRDLTDHEVHFDKPRYAIRARTIDTEPLNIFDHHVFRPGTHNAWSGGADVTADPITGTRNWWQAGTANEKFLFASDGFSGATLEFPTHPQSYTAENDLRRQTGMEFLLNKMILSGDFEEDTAATATISGREIMFANNLLGQHPTIDLTAAQTGSGDFTYEVSLDLILYDDLVFNGDGNVTLNTRGEIRDYHHSRGIIKSGQSTVNLQGPNTYSGDTTVLEGTLSLHQTNAHNDDSTVVVATTGATLNLVHQGIETVTKLLIGDSEQPNGLYRAAGTEGVGTALPQISGPGRLLVQPRSAFHSADFNRDFQLDLPELLRVIELYNTRFGSIRTGRYREDHESTDGFGGDADRGPETVTALTRFHSADSNRNGLLELAELLRVIELYNHRVGTTRTGRYRAETGTVDGFDADNSEATD
ncbi:MAG: hypothetical protein SynsKO_21290 [Synoicihabitans sp.]